MCRGGGGAALERPARGARRGFHHHLHAGATAAGVRLLVARGADRDRSGRQQRRQLRPSSPASATQRDDFPAARPVDALNVFTRASFLAASACGGSLSARVWRAVLAVASHPLSSSLGLLLLVGFLVWAAQRERYGHYFGALF